MIKVLLKTDTKQLELDGSPVRYESYWAILNQPITEENKLAVIEEVERTGDGFIQVQSRAGGEPIYLRASAIKAVKFIEEQKEESDG